uniref:KAPP n=1 Tax=Arundo donax TaxID=35708 RepID=A0A0A9C9E7_ARUDO
MRDVQQQPFLFGSIRIKIVLPSVLILVIQRVS